MARVIKELLSVPHNGVQLSGEPQRQSGRLLYSLVCSQNSRRQDAGWDGFGHSNCVLSGPPAGRTFPVSPRSNTRLGWRRLRRYVGGWLGT
jgi:hypothetical protein